jgi:hypothetical protein
VILRVWDVTFAVSDLDGNVLQLVQIDWPSYLSASASA